MRENTRTLFGVRHRSRGTVSIVVTAGLAVALLLIASAWRIGDVVKIQRNDVPLSYERPTTKELVAERKPLSTRDWQNELAALGLISTSTDRVVATSPQSVADIISEQFLNGYISLKESGRYSQESAASIGRSIGESVRAPSQFVMHGESEVRQVADISKERSLTYRADMRDALAILITDAPPEFETFGLYVETKNPERLRELEAAVTRYRLAEQALLRVIVPQDAVALHLRATNALGAYASAVDQLIRYADEAFATLAVLRTYNDAEREMLYAFDALASYYVRKSADN